MNAGSKPVKRHLSGRDKQLDYVKGWLVVGMVIYHTACINERAGTATCLSIQSIFSFVSGSWIYISGAIIALYYSKNSINNWFAVARRLATRGFKLLAIFLALNASLIALGWANKGLSISWNTLYSALGPGTGDAAFEILSGIGYMLIIAPLLLIGKRFGILFALFIFFSAFIYYYLNGHLEHNYWAITCGMGGFLVGEVLATYLSERPYQSSFTNKWLFVASTSVVILYFMIKFNFSSDKSNVFIYCTGITSILGNLYLSYQWGVKIRKMAYLLDLLGRYPLISYIWQMGVIEYLAFIKSRMNIELPYIVDFTIVLLAVFLSVKLLDVLMYRNEPVKRIYGWVFG